MAFTEKQKLSVKRKAAFQCCRCRDIGVEVHHIVPTEHGGKDAIDNAAPLCPSCHDRFGANPKKRKEIRQMRDFWYDVVREKFPTGKDRTELNDKIVELQRGEVSRDEVIAELQRQVDELAKNLKDSTNGESTTASIQNIANDIVTATRLGDRVYANVHCRKCNSYTGVLVGVDHCPGCGTPLS